MIIILFLISTLSLSHAATGLIRYKSDFDVQITADRLEKVLKEKGMNVFARIDHAANAQKVNLELLPTTLLVFGNPTIGSKLMQINQSIAIDLPMKGLIYQDKTGQVWLAFNNPKFLTDRHGIDAKAIVNKIQSALEGFAKQATQK
jgi:uncharacterized protein (DUF302 family)